MTEATVIIMTGTTRAVTRARTTRVTTMAEATEL